MSGVVEKAQDAASQLASAVGDKLSVSDSSSSSKCHSRASIFRQVVANEQKPHSTSTRSLALTRPAREQRRLPSLPQLEHTSLSPLPLPPTRSHWHSATSSFPRRQRTALSNGLSSPAQARRSSSRVSTSSARRRPSSLLTDNVWRRSVPRTRQGRRSCVRRPSPSLRTPASLLPSL